MPGKITVRNFSTLTEHAALLRAGLYLGGKQEEAEQGKDCRYRFKVMENRRDGMVVKITEVEA